MDVGFCYGIVCEGWFMGFYLEVAGRWSVVCRGFSGMFCSSSDTGSAYESSEAFIVGAGLMVLLHFVEQSWFR